MNVTMKVRGWAKIFVSLCVGALFAASPVFAETIVLKKLSSAPKVDGSANDWKRVKGVTVKLMKPLPQSTTETNAVTVKGGVFGDEVFFMFQWKDSTKNDQHTPYVWDAAKNKYGKDPVMEDRLAVQFAMDSNYTADWFSGKGFESDMWQWKAARSNPVGLIQDKRVILSTTKLKKSFKATARNGKPIYIKRPSDKGGKLYKTKRYSKRDKDVMPKYKLNAKVKGSIADVKAVGVWKNGMWTVEARRKLDTGHSDDAVFTKGKSIKGGIAVFDHTGGPGHQVSKVLKFQF